MGLLPAGSQVLIPAHSWRTSWGLMLTLRQSLIKASCCSVLTNSLLTIWHDWFHDLIHLQPSLSMHSFLIPPLPCQTPEKDVVLGLHCLLKCNVGAAALTFSVFLLLFFSLYLFGSPLLWPPLNDEWGSRCKELTVVKREKHRLNQYLYNLNVCPELLFCSLTLLSILSIHNTQ